MVLSVFAVMLIVPLVSASLWVAVSGISEKVSLSHHLNQIDRIVTTTVHQASLDHRIIDGGERDLLDVLGQLGLLQPTGTLHDIRTLTNPWGGAVTARIYPDARIRIETNVPSNACRHLIGVFQSNLGSTNILAIEITDDAKTWSPIYVKGKQTGIDENDIVTRCGDKTQVGVALIFPAR